jgi:hypothetical protein
LSSSIRWPLTLPSPRPNWGESGTLYGSATTARATSLSRMVWKSRSCARLDFPRLPWSMRLILLRQLHGLPPAIYRCCCWGCFFGGDGGGGASLCSFRGGWFAEGCFFPGHPSCFWRHAIPLILWLAGAPNNSHRGYLGADAGHSLARYPLPPHLLHRCPRSGHACGSYVS